MCACASPVKRGGRTRCGPFRGEVLAKIAGGSFRPSQKAGGDVTLFKDVASLDQATSDDVSFLSNRHYLGQLKETQAGLVIMAPAFLRACPTTTAALICKSPYLAWARVVGYFYPLPKIQGSCHPSASIAASADVDSTASVGAFAVIGENARVGAGVSIGAHSVVSEGVDIGQGSSVGAHVTLCHCRLGKNVKILSGTRVGQEGFGFAASTQGFETIPQLGRVLIADDVEIGANCTIDRGSLNDTVIGKGTRIDNLVQIGHNVKMGRYCVVVSQAGVSGSTILEDGVVMAAQSGLVGHIKIGAGARIGAQCGVMSDVSAGEDVIGSPAMPFREFFRNVAQLRKLSKRSHVPKDSKDEK